MKADHELIDTYLDGELTAEEESRLADWLAVDPGNMQVFVRETHLHRQLREIMLADSFQVEIEAPVEKTERASRRLPVDLIGRAIGQWFAFPAPEMLRRPWLVWAFCLTLIICTGVWLFGPTMGRLTLAEIHGTGFSVERAGHLLPAGIGIRLQPGDVLRTPEQVTAVIGFAPENTRLKLLPGIELALTDLSHGKRFALGVGRLEASVARQRPYRPMLITTPQAEARVVGTRFSLTVTTNTTRLDVTEGKVKFTRTSDDVSVKVSAGHYAVAAADYELAALPFTGAILREWWTGVTGKVVNDLKGDPRYPNRPDGSDMARTLELSPMITNRFGVRFCGYVHPPVTGDYEFWLTGATDATLFMSPDENPSHEVPIARIVDNSRKLDQPRFQGSSPWAPPVSLVAGRRYYIEALVLVEKGEGHLSVAWKRPGASRELLTGDYLSPFKPN
jgi:hypothetical protein